MAFSGNDLPIGPAGGFPRQRIRTAGNVLRPVQNVEGDYLNSPVAKLPTVEKEYSSVVKRATGHMNYGEVKIQNNMKSMGGGFQREIERKKLVNYKPMPGHTNKNLSEEENYSHGPKFKIDKLTYGKDQSDFPDF